MQASAASAVQHGQNGSDTGEAQGDKEIKRPERKDIKRTSRPGSTGGKGMTLKSLLESYSQPGGEGTKEPEATKPAGAAPRQPTGNGHANRGAERSLAGASSDELVLSENDQAILTAAGSLTATPEQIKQAALLLAAHQSSITAKATPGLTQAKAPAEITAGGTNRVVPGSGGGSGSDTPLAGGRGDSARGSLHSAAKATGELPSDSGVDLSVGGLSKIREGEKQEEQSESSDLLVRTPREAKEDEVNAVLSDAFVRLAESYYEQGNFAEAEKLYGRILSLREKEEGPKSPTLISALNNLAGVLCVQSKFDEAAVYVQRSVNILESNEPDNILRLADALNTLAGIYYQQVKYEQCEPLLERALRLRQRALGEAHPDIADNLRDYAKFLKKVGRADEAEEMYAQAKAILAQALKKVT
jgi:tetratricopeptide (TPR) repeat protein